MITECQIGLTEEPVVIFLSNHAARPWREIDYHREYGAPVPEAYQAVILPEALAEFPAPPRFDFDVDEDNLRLPAENRNLRDEVGFAALVVREVGEDFLVEKGDLRQVQARRG